jgi:hypothetical protein
MKKQSQLGINPSTASHRLVKDILYSLVLKTDQNNCFQCGKPMSRETFSIEHRVPWLDSENPVGLFFDLDNISFSHKTCNYEAKRSAPPAHGNITMYRTGCRCNVCIEGIKNVYKDGNYKRDEARKLARQAYSKISSK